MCHVHDALDEWAARQPDAEFVVDGRTRLTYGEAAAATRRLAGAFRRAGLDPGDRVAILARNSASFILAYYAASRSGVTLVPINWRLAPADIAVVLADAQPRIVLADDANVAAVDRLRAELSFVEHFVAVGTAPPGWQTLSSWMCGPPLVCTSDDLGRAVLYQMYTSGTTGRPKAALLTHSAVTANVRQISRSIAIAIEPSERSLVVAPLFHAAVVPSVFSAVAGGASLYVLDRFQPAAVVDALSERGIGFAVLVPSMIRACLEEVPDVADRQYERLRLIYYGASPIEESTLRRAMAAFRCGFLQSYGLTEATQALTLLSPADHRRGVAGEPELLLSAGRPLPGTAIRIVDAEGRMLGTGETGEILACGPQLMSGYFQRPQASRRTLRDGWLHTGDSGYVDADGYLYVRDRFTDVIISGGENVSPRAVEAVLSTHPAVKDVAVIGVPDPRWGEAVSAVVVLRDGCEAAGADLIDYCRGRMGGFQRPRSIELVDELPRNASGKVLRRVLRERHWKGALRRVAGA